MTIDRTVLTSLAIWLGMCDGEAAKKMNRSKLCSMLFKFVGDSTYTAAGEARWWRHQPRRVSAAVPRQRCASCRVPLFVSFSAPMYLRHVFSDGDGDDGDGGGGGDGG